MSKHPKVTCRCGRLKTREAPRCRKCPKPGNSLLERHPGVASELLHEDPALIPFAAQYKCSFKCPRCSLIYEATPASRVRVSTGGCPRCSGHRWTHDLLEYIAWNCGEKSSADLKFVENDCLLWTGPIWKGGGYGAIHCAGHRSAVAHRVVYGVFWEQLGLPELLPNDIGRHKDPPPELTALQHRLCVNPYHVMPGSRAQNNKDRSDYVLMLEAERLRLTCRVAELEKLRASSELKA